LNQGEEKTKKKVQMKWKTSQALILLILTSKTQCKSMRGSEESESRTRSDRSKLLAFFQPAEKIRPKQLQISMTKVELHEGKDGNELVRQKRRPFLLDVRIPSKDDKKQKVTQKPQSYLSTLWLSDLTTVTPTGQREEESTHKSHRTGKEHLPDQESEVDRLLHPNQTKIDTKEAVRQKLDSNQEQQEVAKYDNETPENSTAILLGSQAVTFESTPADFVKDNPTVTFSPTYSENSVKDNATVVPEKIESVSEIVLEEDSSNKIIKSCYTHTVNWLGRCVVLCDKRPVRPCVFYAEPLDGVAQSIINNNDSSYQLNDDE